MLYTLFEHSGWRRVASRFRPKLTMIDTLTPHMLRHTYATILYNAGVNAKSAQSFLGHADIKMTLRDIYPSFSPKGAGSNSLSEPPFERKSGLKKS